MNNIKSFSAKLHEVNDQSFEDIALEVFQFQVRNNPLYGTYVKHLGISSSGVKAISDIPFLPISFFKTHAIKTGDWLAETTFTSSGTTGSSTSRHLVPDVNFYLKNSLRCFQERFGEIKNYHILALLPSYLERTGSSLIAMIDYFIRESNSAESGFYLNEYDDMIRKIEQVKHSGRKVLLWGVSFALLDFAEKYRFNMEGCLIFETGGMKGRRKEITRNELHSFLRERLNPEGIFSEYGMTELMSQAYTDGSLMFQPPATMRVLGRDLTDPFHTGITGETAAINIIDLANLHSISFVETEDMGRVYPDKTFEILGRVDNSDVRGCNLLV